jgi:DNA-binding IclR family transcriptional regulator
MAHHRTIDRVAYIMEFVASHSEGVTLSEIAAAVGAPVSSIHMLLEGLVSVGYLDRTAARYVLGPAPYVLTLRAQQSPAQMVTHRDLEVLAEEDNFTVLLCVRVGDHVVSIDEAGFDPMLQHMARARLRIPALQSCLGRVFVAALNDREMHEYLRRHQQQDLVEAFLGELAAIRSSGVALDLVKGFVPRGGTGTEVAVLAAPVYDREGRPIASVAIGQDPAYVSSHLQALTELLLRHCQHWATRQNVAESLYDRPHPASPKDSTAARRRRAAS